MQCAVLLFKFKLFSGAFIKSRGAALKRSKPVTLTSMFFLEPIFKVQNFRFLQFGQFGSKSRSPCVISSVIVNLHELILTRIAFYQWNDRSIY